VKWLQNENYCHTGYTCRSKLNGEVMHVYLVYIVSIFRNDGTDSTATAYHKKPSCR